MNRRFTYRDAFKPGSAAAMKPSAVTGKIILSAIIVLLAGNLQTAHSEKPNGQSDLHVLYEERMQERRSSEWALFGWGSANVVGGSAMTLTGSGYSDFGLMSLAWGAINMAIVTPSLFFSGRPDFDEVSFNEHVREELRYQRIVAINAGLNVSYMLSGAGMLHFGDTSQIRQFGSSIIVQGAFLFIYDLVLLRQSSRYLNRLTESENWEISAGLFKENPYTEAAPVMTLRIQL